MKTLRTFLAEAVNAVIEDPETGWAPELVEAAVRATRDWLAQPEIEYIVAHPVAAGAALRAEAVK